MAIFTNRATLSYNGISVNSNTVTGNLLEVLAVTKTAVGDNYTPGEAVTYIISITNTSTTPFVGVSVSDNLGEYPFGTGTVVPLEYVDGSAVYYQNGILQPSPTVSSTQPLTFTGISVPAGGNAIIVYEAQTNGYAPLEAGSTVTNEVAVTAPGIATPATDSETVSVETAPLLSITKCLSPVNVSENGELTYTFTIQNSGNVAALEGAGVVVSDVFNPILSSITVTLNGSVLPATSYTYNEATGEFATLPGVITVPAATYAQDPVTGLWVTTPGVTTVTVSGIV